MILPGTGRPCFIALRFIVFHRYCTFFNWRFIAALHQAGLSPCSYPFNSTCSLQVLLSLYLILVVFTVFQTSTGKMMIAYWRFTWWLHFLAIKHVLIKVIKVYILFVLHIMLFQLNILYVVEYKHTLYICWESKKPP